MLSIRDLHSAHKSVLTRQAPEVAGQNGELDNTGRFFEGTATEACAICS